MKKRVLQFTTLLLSISILSYETATMSAYAREVNVKNVSVLIDLPEVLDDNLDINSITEFISNQSKNNKDIEFTDDGVFINGIFYTPEEFDTLLDGMQDPVELEIALRETPEKSLQSRAFYIPAVGYASTWLYAVPGVGQVAVVATAATGVVIGAYILGKGVVKAGHWAHGRIKSHVNARPRPRIKTTTSYNYKKSVSKRDFVAYKFNISNRILDGNGRVKIGEFKDKNGRPPKNTDGKSNKRFKNGRYDIQKDKTNHKGRYKLNKNGKRVGTVDGDGTISGK